MSPGPAMLLAVLALSTGTAASAAHLVERLDRDSGATVTTLDTVAVFARPRPQYSRSARDYLYVGPLEINRRGQLSYYLWVGVGTTLDRGYLAPASPPPVALYITVEGAPVELPLRPLAELAGTRDGGAGYETPVRLDAAYFARVTLDQLRLLGGAELDQITVKTAGDTLERYALWARKPDWSAFVNRGARVSGSSAAGPGR